MSAPGPGRGGRAAAGETGAGGAAAGGGAAPTQQGARTPHGRRGPPRRQAAGRTGASALTKRLAEGRLALALLTRVPVGRIEPCPPMGAAVWAFPLAGLVPGVASGLALWGGLGAGLPPLAAALGAVAAGALTTGGLHEDGLADLADGLSGGRSRERRLEIMRDSRIGSHGALALMLAVGLRAAALAALSGPAALAVPMAAAMLSRGLLGPVMAVLRPARPDGLGRGAAEGLTPARAWAGAGLGAAGMLALLATAGPDAGIGGGSEGGTGFAAGVAAAGMAALAAAVATTGTIAAMARARLGGFTGDVLGAAQVLAEIAVLLVLCR